jgi:hypothetical protein
MRCPAAAMPPTRTLPRCRRAPTSARNTPWYAPTAALQPASSTTRAARCGERRRAAVRTSLAWRAHKALAPRVRARQRSARRTARSAKTCRPSLRAPRTPMVVPMSHSPRSAPHRTCARALRPTRCARSRAAIAAWQAQRRASTASSRPARYRAMAATPTLRPSSAPRPARVAPARRAPQAAPATPTPRARPPGRHALAPPSRPAAEIRRVAILRRSARPATGGHARATRGPQRVARMDARSRQNSAMPPISRPAC